ncbi:TonB-dependent receptor [candidate division KSB1 bacterium]|nr:TonB-dependent receptor [candidate division KSB1 bacterium]
MMKNVKLLAVPILLFTLVLCFTTQSFAALGKIAGVVTDATSGEVLPGVNVQVEGTRMGAATNLQGQYTIINLPPGTYNVVFTYMGYATKKVTGVRAQIDATTTVNGQLSQTVIEGETVTVVAEQPIVDKTMTATKVTFSEEMIDNQLPVSNLNEILSSSVTTQNMRGANKTGVGYLVDGVKITDPFASTGAGSQGYSMLKRETTAQSSTTGRFEDNSVLGAGGRDVSMVQTLVDVAQSSVQEVNVVAGTINAEYSASGGVVNIASKSGGSELTAKVYMRSSLGGLDHAGPDVYDAKDPELMGGKSAAEAYLDWKTSLAAGDEGSQARAAMMTWTPGKYEYGDDPTINTEIYVGGPLTSKGNFFFSGSMLNDHGRFPGEFRRGIDGSLKLNYNLTNSDKLTWMGKLQDGGKLGGWYNRFYTYSNQFYLEAQPVSQTLGYMTYLKHNHIFDANTFLESTISLVGNTRTYGFAPKDDQLLYDNYGDEFLILDSAEKATKYMTGGDGNNIFIHDAGNNNNYVVPALQNQGRFGKAGYSYENYETSALTFATNFTKQVNFNHQIKTGAEYTINSIDVLTHNVSAGWMPAPFQYILSDYKVNPWNLGTYIQDRIEYEGIIVNLGLRFDGYSMDTQSVKDLFNPGVWDTTSYGMAYLKQDLGDKNDPRFYFSPRLGISHPISETATMHYSWGIYTTQPNKAYWLQDYGVLANISLPRIWDSDPEPERSTAYEIGVTTALTSDIGADLTAFYRDNRNASVLNYEISGYTGQPFGRMNFFLNYGYRDSRGLELSIWKRPTPNRYFGVVGVSGNLSASYSYDSPASAALSLVQDKNVKNTFVASSAADRAFDLDLRFLYPTYTRSYSDINGKLTLLFDFPMDFRVSTITTYRSPWRFNKTIDVTNTRYEEKLDGDHFFQTDIRLSKFFAFGKYRAGFFVEALNAFDRVNILSYETYISNTMYEEDGIPWGPLNRPVNNNGIPYAGIARELYAGFEFAF